MKPLARYIAMEQSCRRHAELDKSNSERWLEEAELWSKLAKLEQRLQMLGKVRRPRAARSLKTNSRLR